MAIVGLCNLSAEDKNVADLYKTTYQNITADWKRKVRMMPSVSEVDLT